MTDMTVANTILQQLGGRQFLAMTGAKKLVGSETSLRFRLPRLSGALANFVVVTLTPEDLYKVDFYKGSVKNPKLVKSVDGVFCGDLITTGEEHTGFLFHL